MDQEIKSNPVFYRLSYDIIYDNLKRNLMNNMDKSENQKEDKYIQCEICGEWFERPKQSKSTLCPKCQKENDKANSKLRMRKLRERKKNVTLC